ncbi:MAG TPA: hypothetical protein VFD66_05435 [Verrucomicrobiae bacterium]|nr:hypothetical protein [Verrucomicrobiae bacterium]
MDDGATLSTSTLRHRAQFRLAGIVVLVLGIGSACLLYWIRTHNGAWVDDPSLAGYSRPATQQMGVLYGKMGLMVSDFFNDFKQPGVQAMSIAAASALAGFVCFFLAGNWHDGDEPGSGSGKTGLHRSNKP